MNIANITPADLPQALQTQQMFTAPSGTEKAGTFSELVTDMLQTVNAEDKAVSVQTQQLMTGETSNFHEVSLAVARADMSFRFMMEVRDQLIGAFKEVIRMQV